MLDIGFWISDFDFSRFQIPDLDFGISLMQDITQTLIFKFLNLSLGPIL